MSKIKNNNSLAANEEIRNAIRQIALHGLVNNNTGEVRGTGRTSGYVAKIHTEGELAGTVDVQEFMNLEECGEGDTKLGYHEGVLLSSIQDCSKGYVIIPKLYSDVIISQAPEGGKEYVVMFSHVDTIQLDSHENIIVEVKEREEYNDSDPNTPDVEDLAETGVYAKTTYNKNSITSEIQDADSSNYSKTVVNGQQILNVVGKDDSSIEITHDNIIAKHNTSEVNLNDTEATVFAGSSKVKVTDGKVFVGNDVNTDDAVLGVELATLLSELAGYIGQIVTSTMMGPQCPINVAKFLALKARIDSYKSSHSGFLTQKVQIQK